MSPIIEELHKRRDQADREFNQLVTSLMEKYRFQPEEKNQTLRRIEFISMIDQVEEKRRQMIHWNNSLQEFKRLDR